MKQMKRKYVVGGVLVAGLVLPVVCAGLVIHSFWDPFGQTAKLPVAVVNEDQPVTYQGKRLAVGQQVVSQLKHNHELGWRFLSAREAAAGMKRNRYYTVVTIPKNFSQRATTVTDSQPQQMKLTYQTNASLNYIGEIISQTGASQLNTAVKRAVTKAYALSMFQQIKTSGRGFQTAAKGATQLKDGTVTLADGMNTYTTGVTKVKNGLLQLSTKVAQLPTGVRQLRTGSGQLSAGLGTLQTKVQPLASGASQLSAGADRLATGSGQVEAGLQQLSVKTQPLVSGVQRLTTGSSQVTAGLEKLNRKTGALASGVVQLADGSQALAVSTTRYVNGVYQVNTGLHTLATGAQSLSQAIDQLAAGSQTLAGQVAAGKTGVTTLGTSVEALTTQSASGSAGLSLLAGQASQKLKQDLGTLSAALSGSNQSASRLSRVQDKANQLSGQLTGNDESSTTAQAASKLKTAVAQLDAGDQATHKGMTQAEITAKVSSVAAATKMTADQKAAMTSALAGAGQTASADTATSSAKTAVSTATNDLVKASGHTSGTDQTAAKQTVTSLKRDVAALAAQGTADQGSSAQAALAAVAQDATVLQGVFDQAQTLMATQNAALGKINAGVNGKDSGLVAQYQKLIAGTQQLDAGLQQTHTKVPTLTAGINQLVDGGQKLTANGPALIEGTQKLATGTEQLNGQIPTLTGGVTRLVAGSLQVTDGLGLLNGQLPALTSGVTQLTSGSGQVHAGAQQLAGGLGQLTGQVPTLIAGVSKLANGSNRLTTGLTTLDQQAPQLVSGVQQLATGSQQLAANSPKLIAGAHKLTTGNGKLATALQGGADKVKATPLTSRTAAMFASPSTLSHERFSDVPNFGHAIAPFVVAMVTFLGLTGLVAGFDYRKQLRTPRQLATLTGWTLLQALITSAGMAIMLHAAQPLAFMSLTGLFALAVLVVELVLRFFMGRAAVLVVGVLFFLQLCVANGIFPVQTVKTLYAPLAKFLPITYANLGLTEALNGTGISTAVLTMGISAAVVIIVVGSALIGFKIMRPNESVVNEAQD